MCEKVDQDKNASSEHDVQEKNRRDERKGQKLGCARSQYCLHNVRTPTVSHHASFFVVQASHLSSLDLPLEYNSSTQAMAQTSSNAELVPQGKFLCTCQECIVRVWEDADGQKHPGRLYNTERTVAKHQEKETMFRQAAEENTILVATLAGPSESSTSRPDKAERLRSRSAAKGKKVVSIHNVH